MALRGSNCLPISIARPVATVDCEADITRGERSERELRDVDRYNACRLGSWLPAPRTARANSNGGLTKHRSGSETVQQPCFHLARTGQAFVASVVHVCLVRVLRRGVCSKAAVDLALRRFDVVFRESCCSMRCNALGRRYKKVARSLRRREVRLEWWWTSSVSCRRPNAPLLIASDR